MRTFLIVTLILSIITLALFVGYLYLVKRYKSEKCKHVWEYFIPSLASLALAGLVLFGLTPYLLDSIDLITNNTLVRNIVVEDVVGLKSVDTIDGERFGYSPFEDEPEAQGNYQVSMTRRTNFTYNYIELEGQVQ